MAYLPNTLPRLLRDAGLNVVVHDGWETRGRPPSTGLFDPVGVLNHHTGASMKGRTLKQIFEYAQWMFLVGRPDDGLPPPLCQIALAPNGDVHLGAAGRANHAGKAKASGSVASGDGNFLYVGVEWMLSGKEDIPAEMTRAGVTLNAVLTGQVLRTSERTVSCHYQTSVTGKWDIGDPNGIEFNNHKVLDVVKFRRAVAAERERLAAPKTPSPTPAQRSMRVRVAHLSGQFSDSPGKWKHDVSAVMMRGYDWITGTEAGEKDNWDAIRAVASKYGYSLRRHGSNWIALKRSVFVPGTVRGGSHVVADTRLVAGPGHDTGYVWATFTHSTPGVGKISVIASHYPTKGRPDAKDPAYRVNLRWTKKLGRSIAVRMRELGKGRALTFYGGDQNIEDRTNNTFFHRLPISCWDELGEWPGTGYGTIDVIARSKRDNRVTCVRARRFTDKQLFLYTDHFLIEAVYEIRY